MAEVAEEVAPAPTFFAEDVGGSVIVEPGALPPTTPGTLTLPAAAMKFADLTESGSESGDGEAGGQPGTSASASVSASASGRSSPPPNCAICLSRCRRKCFTDSCMHQFCFKCLCEWSKIKPECPLCKQPFKTIIHNVRTLDDYDRYPVQTTSPSMQEHSSLRFHIVRRPRYVPLVQNQAVMTNDIDAGAEIGGGVLVAAGGVAAGEDGILRAVAEEVVGSRHTYSRFEPYRMELMNFYRQDQEAASPNTSLSQLWRRYVYDRKLYALPVSDSSTGHFRQWSARFYRNNPAQMHRLMPWIQRDIICLLRNAAHSVSTVMQLMNDILPMTNILGPTFRRRLTPYLGDRTSHFIHELFNFARSPFDMIGYDHVVQYSARVAEEVEVDLLDMVETQSSNGSELHLDVGDGDGDGEAGNAESSNDWSAASGRPSTSVIVTNPSATHSFSVTMASDGSELPGISIRRTATSNVGSQTVAINLSMRRPAEQVEAESEVIEIDDGDAAANAEVAAITDGSSSSRRNAGAALPVSAHIELQSSSSSGDEDECVFVLELKPPHLRTPEQVSLDSNSDSDVVFVDEQRENPATANPEAPSTAEAATRDQGLFMGPSTSAAAKGGKNWELVLEEVRRKDQRRATRVRQLNYFGARSASNPSSNSSSSFNFSSDSDDSSSSSSDSEGRKKKRRRPKASRKRPAKAAQRPRRKRSRRQTARRKLSPKQEEHEQDLPPEQPQMPLESSSDSGSSSDDESAADSSGTLRPSNSNANKDTSSSDDSDDDSTENLQLSALRATLKAEATLEDRKPLKRELQLPEDEVENQQLEPTFSHQALSRQEDIEPGCSEPKRRRSCSNSNLSNYSYSSSTESTSSAPVNSFIWPPSKYGKDPLVRGAAVEELDIANSLIELAPLSSEARREMDEIFNVQSDGAEDSISFLSNDLPRGESNLERADSPLGLYSDDAVETEVSQEPMPLDAPIDVVGEAEVETAEDTATANEEQDEDDDEENEEPNAGEDQQTNVDEDEKQNTGDEDEDKEDNAGEADEEEEEEDNGDDDGEGEGEDDDDNEEEEDQNSENSDPDGVYALLASLE
ncbi:E3 ubiquitin-protein ligase Topors [Drosophila bipectinata]|uniref:E3 ubiquitin-protein ligase Topors n=1 Tax=Drosophila bipectinata TaxID=42026 RepID=UPI001C894371|nr:E3 ubiquitin-protein ligase Topors [Drosophila bipectinata]